MQTPKLGRSALLTLVEWIAKNKNRSECVETHGVGENPTAVSLSFSQCVGTHSVEENKNNSGSDNQ